MVPIKTPEGQAELKTRARRVSQRHRTMLFLVDEIVTIMDWFPTVLELCHIKQESSAPKLDGHSHDQRPR